MSVCDQNAPSFTSRRRVTARTTGVTTGDNKTAFRRQKDTLKPFVVSFQPVGERERDFIYAL